MSRQDDPEPWGSSQPHNAHMEMMSRIHLPIRHGTRLELKQLNALSTLHLSWNNTPETLKYPRFMITADAVRQTRANSSPPVPSLNQFEIHCMNHWHDTQVSNLHTRLSIEIDLSIQWTRMAPQWVRVKLSTCCQRLPADLYIIDPWGTRPRAIKCCYRWQRTGWFTFVHCPCFLSCEYDLALISYTHWLIACFYQGIRMLPSPFSCPVELTQHIPRYRSRKGELVLRLYQSWWPRAPCE